MDLTIIGVIGGIIVLIMFALNNLKKISNESPLYDFMNFVGSAFLVIYAIWLGSVPYLIINLVWGTVSLVDVIKYLIHKNTKKL